MIVPRPELIEIRHPGATTRASYDALYSAEGIARQRSFLDRLLGWLDARPGLRFLDAACGEAELVARAGELGMVAHGIDFSAAALRRAPDSTRGLAVADGEALPYADDAFDRVASVGSLEHYEDPLRGAIEIARVLRPGGLALVMVPNAFGLRWNVAYVWRHGDVCDDGQPLQRYGTRRQWARLLGDAGLAVVRTVGYEGEMAGWHDWLSILRHPSRALVPAGPLLPANMASHLVYICRKAATARR